MMVDTITDRYESALKMLANITEAGGYMKEEVREDIQKAVSIDVKERESEHHLT